MAIISISRQVAAKGDEVAVELAKKLNYRFVKRTDIEKRILELGFSESKMPKYDERKPGFFASLAKDRDEYLNYVQYAMLEAASQQNVIIIGRGAFVTLQDVPNNISVRLVASDSVRLQRLMEEFSWDEKQARQRIQESDANRQGYHNSFYNVDVKDNSLFHIVLNTGLLDIEPSADVIADYVNKYITADKEAEGKKIIQQKLKCQEVINKLVFEYKVGIEFMHAEIVGNEVVLHGVSQSAGVVEQALRLIQNEMPEYSVKSAVSVVHDFKSYQ